MIRLFNVLKLATVSLLLFLCLPTYAQPLARADQELLESFLRQPDVSARHSLYLANRENLGTAWMQSVLSACLTLAQTNESAKALKTYGVVVEIARWSADKKMLATALFQQGQLLAADWPRAAECIREARDIYRSLGEEGNQAAAMLMLGTLEFRQYEEGYGEANFREAAPLFHRLGNLPGEGNALLGLSLVNSFRGEVDVALTNAAEALVLFEKAGDEQGIALSHQSLGLIAVQQSNLAKARIHYEQARELFKKRGSLGSEAYCVMALGDVAISSRDDAEALKYYTDAQRIYSSLGFLNGTLNDVQNWAYSWLQLARIATRKGDFFSAQKHAEKSRQIYKKINDKQGELNSTEQLAVIARRSSDLKRARETYEYALQLGEANATGFRNKQKARILYALGEVCAEGNDLGTARRHLVEAAVLFDRAQQRGDTIQGALGFSEFLGNISGNPSSPDSLLHEYALQFQLEAHSSFHAYRQLALVELRLGELPEAQIALTNALIRATYRREKAGAGSQRFQYQENIAADFKAAILAFAPKLPAFALSMREQFMARSFQEALSVADALVIAGVTGMEIKRG